MNKPKRTSGKISKISSSFDSERNTGKKCKEVYHLKTAETVRTENRRKVKAKNEKTTTKIKVERVPRGQLFWETSNVFLLDY